MSPLARRPLTGIAIGFIAGIILGQELHVPSAVPLAAGSLSLLASILCGVSSGRAAGSVAGITLLISIACIGWAHAALGKETRPACVSSLLPTPAKGAGIIGVLDEDAIPMGTNANRIAWKTPVSLEMIRLPGESSWRPVAGTAWVRFHAPASFKPPRYGDRWAFSGYLDPGSGTTARRTHSETAFMSAGRSAHWITGNQGLAVIRFALQARAMAREFLNHGIHHFPRQSAILDSLLLGVRGQVPKELYQAFANTSTLHVFAISGSHIVILGGVLVLALSSMGMPRTHWILALAPALILYTIMTGLQSSASRACIMGILFWSAPLIGRKPDLYSSLGAAAIALLAWDPGNVTDAGFLLSFIAVIGLALFTPVLFAPFHRRLQRHPFQIQPEPWWKQACRKSAIAIAALIAMTVSASLVSAPLTAYYFGSIAPIGLLGNLLAVPLASLMILTGALSLLLGACALVFADIFNHANVALAFTLDRFIAFLSAVPGGHWAVPPPPLWIIISFYTLLLIGRFTLWLHRPGHTRDGSVDLS